MNASTCYWGFDSILSARRKSSSGRTDIIPGGNSYWRISASWWTRKRPISAAGCTPGRDSLCRKRDISPRAGRAWSRWRPGGRSAAVGRRLKRRRRRRHRCLMRRIRKVLRGPGALINWPGCWASVPAVPPSKETKSFRHWMFRSGSPRIDHLSCVGSTPDGRLLMVQQHQLNERRGPIGP